MRDLFKRVEVNWIALIALGTLGIANLLGYAIVFQAESGIWILAIFGGVALIAAILFAPIEWMILAGMLGTMLADTRFVPSGLIYYARFVPMGMFALRTLLEFLVRRGHVLPITRVFLLPSVPILLLAFVSSVYGTQPEIIFQRAVSMLFVIGGFAIGLPYYWRTPEQTERGLKWVVALLIGVLFVGATLFDLNPQYAFYQGEFVRLSGIFWNPNTQGLIAMLCIFPALWWWQVERDSVRKFVLTLGVLLSVVVILIAGSRASFVGSVVGAMAWLWLRVRISGLSLILLSLATVFVIWLGQANPLLGRVLQFSVDADRLLLWQRAVELGMRSPIWGVGLGASDALFAADRPYLLSIGMATSGSHSSYLRMFVDLGLLGVGFGFLMFIVVLGRVFTAAPNTRRDSMVVFLTSAVIAGLANAAFEDWLFGFGSGSTPIMWFFLALLALRVEMLARQISPTIANADQPRESG